MSDDKQTASSVTLNLSDPKLWALIAALAGGQFVASKVSISGVETQQQKASETAEKASDAAVQAAAKAVETQVSIDEKLERLTRFQGELGYRLESLERRVREIPDTIETKGKR